MQKLLTELWRDQEGQDLTEYGLLLVLLSLSATAGTGTMANAIGRAFLKAAALVTGTVGN